jgi:hypothetical protein
LPTVTDQEKFGIKIIKLPNTIHNDMNDRGNKRQKKINAYILGFLKELKIYKIIVVTAHHISSFSNS